MGSYVGGCAIGDWVGRVYCVERYVSQLTVGSFDSDYMLCWTNGCSCYDSAKVQIYIYI